MVTVRTKYKIRVGQVLFDMDTEVEVVEKNDPRVLAVFPGMKDNPASLHVAVVFPGRDHITIVDKSQLKM